MYKYIYLNHFESLMPKIKNKVIHKLKQLKIIFNIIHLQKLILNNLIKIKINNKNKFLITRWVIFNNTIINDYNLNKLM